MLLGFKGQKYLFFEIVGLKGLKYQYSLFFPIYRDLFCHTIHGTLGNTAQSTPDGFARHLLAYFPSYHTNFPCNTTVLLRQIYAI